MKKTFIIFMIAFCSCIATKGQNYLDHLQEKNAGQGSVTVNQSSSIDNLVNGTDKSGTTVTGEKATDNTTGSDIETAKEEKPKYNKADLTATDSDVADVDMSRKMMTNAKRVVGYRVQAYSGASGRTSKQQAEDTRLKIKRRFPNQPVYVHFQSPRWVCQVGNCRTQEEANLLCQQIKSIGINTAIVVKRTITVKK